MDDPQPEVEPRRGSFSEALAETSPRPDRDLDAASLRNMSELLAGLRPEPPAPEEIEPGQAPPTLGPVWERHADAMDAVWGRLDARLAAIRSWSETELSDLDAPGAPLLYPFGGPDLITALAFFPDAKSYILVGLEAPGRLPMPEEFSGESLAADLERLTGAFGSLAESGYFVRTEIDKGVHGGAFDGILPILVISLVRDGQVPLAVDYVEFDPASAEIVPLAEDRKEAGAIRISFRRDGDESAPVRTVYYFAQDLSNRGLLTDEPFAKLLRGQSRLNVYMKSAEYLLHTNDFSTFRKLILEKSSALLQDDSGIPIRYLTSDRWMLRFFGRYENVLAAYKLYHQDDLQAAFAKADPPELGFEIGYTATIDGGGLMLAERREP